MGLDINVVAAEVVSVLQASFALAGPVQDSTLDCTYASFSAEYIASSIANCGYSYDVLPV